MFNIAPKEDKFYKLFIDYSQIIYNSAEKLKDFMYDLSNSEEKLKQIKDLEHQADKQLHEIIAQLNISFITPIDREDIYDIAKVMDDIVDNIESSASRFVMFNVSEATEEAKTLCDMIVQSTKEMITLMEEFKHMNKSKKIKDQIIEINRIEELGDTASRQAIRKLFTGEIPVIDVIKWREIYEFLENTLDSCETVANMVEGVVMKNV